MFKAFAMSLFVVLAFAVQANAGIPACTSENEGQTVLIEGGLNGPEVYICVGGQWLPAALVTK